MAVEVLIKNSKGVFGGRKEKKARKGKRARGERRETAVRLIKIFRRSLLGEERKESEKREMTQRVTMKRCPGEFIRIRARAAVEFLGGVDGLGDGNSHEARGRRRNL